MKIFEVFYIYDVTGFKEFFMPCQIFVVNRVKTDYVKSDSFILPLNDIIQHLIVYTGITAGRSFGVSVPG